MALYTSTLKKLFDTQAALKGANAGEMKFNISGDSLSIRMDANSRFVFPVFMIYYEGLLKSLAPDITLPMEDSLPRFMLRPLQVLKAMSQGGIQTVQLQLPAWQSEKSPFSTPAISAKCRLMDFARFSKYIMDPGNSKLFEHIQRAKKIRSVPPQIFPLGQRGNTVSIMIGGACTSGCQSLDATLADVKRGVNYVFGGDSRLELLPQSKGR